MSLINEMLRDLEKRRKREERGVSCDQTPVVVAGEKSSNFLLLAGGVLLLAGIAWLGFKMIPGISPETSVVATFSAPHEVIPAVAAEKESLAAIAVPVAVGIADALPPAVKVLGEDSAPLVSEKMTAELRTLGIVGAEGSTQLSLTFAQLPEYRLVQNDIGSARFEVSFSQTRIGAGFEIPPLTGTLLKQVSLVPQKQTLQLLVDLVDHATVQSFQLVDGAEQGYHLFIEIVAAAPVAKKRQELLADSEPKPAVVGNKEDSVVPKANKNRSRLSRDQQAYQAGLEQLQQGDRVAAEESFSQALLLNPKLEDARLQLIELLQQQMELVKAEELLQQGLLLAPENPAFRKIYARLLLNDQRQSEAIALLKTDPLPTVVEDLEYYALLAALLQDTRQFEEASSIYGQLLQVRPQEALWWMGMAISLEQSGHFEPARNAYQEALSLPGLRPDLQNYIQSRMQALSTK